MNTFICNNYHLSVLAVEIKYHHIDVSVNGAKLSAEEIARELFKTNLKSVNHRSEHNVTANFIFDRSLLVSGYKCYSPIEIIKAAHCYEQQSCKHPCYENSLAGRFINCLIDTKVYLMKGYPDTAWELEKSTETLRSINNI